VPVADNVCLRPWAFERVPNKMIRGLDRALIYTSTKETCLAACLNEVTYKQTMLCLLCFEIILENQKERKAAPGNAFQWASQLGPFPRNEKKKSMKLKFCVTLL